MTAAIQAAGLAFSHGRTPVLRDVSFKAESGELLALAGHNGAGKSTLIKLALGLWKPTLGKLEVLGGRPGTQPLRVGYLPENVSFYNTMSVREHLAYFSRLKGVAARDALGRAEGLGLGPVMDRRPSSLSKGQRQRLGLAQALLSSPDLLLLDEPTAGLDPDASSFMYRSLASLRDAGRTVLVCTHELALAEPYVDKALVLSHGKVMGFGTLEELRRSLRLPVEVTFAGPVPDDPTLATLFSGKGLLVPEERLERVLQRLTRDLSRYDFSMRRAGLPEIYEKLASSERGGK